MSIFMQSSNSIAARSPSTGASVDTEGFVRRGINLSGATALILHEESYAGYGLTSILRKQQCEVTMLNLDQAESMGALDTDSPDVCFCGNMEDCSPALLDKLHLRFPKTRIVLFDLDLEDDADVTEYATSCLQMGFDDFLPAYSSEDRLLQQISGIFARAARCNADDGVAENGRNQQAG